MRLRTALITSLLASSCNGVGLSPYSKYEPDNGTTDPILPGGNGGDTDQDTDGGGLGTDTSPTGAGDTDVVDTDLPPASAPQVTAVEPDYGTNFGGTEVRLTGVNLGAGLQVEFGGEAATVVSASGTTAVVKTPPVSVVGKVSVKATTTGGSGTLPDAYRYWADAVGKVGGLIVLDKTRYRGGYWSNPNLSWAAVYGGFLTPVAGFEFWKLFAPTMGSCANNYSSGVGFTYRDPGATKLTVTAGGNTVDMPEDTTMAGFFGSADLALTDAPSSTFWQLDPVVGPAWWPSFTVEQLLKGLDNFEVTSPAINSTNSPNVGQSFDIRWNGSGGDYVIFVLTHYTLSGGSTTAVQEVTCAVPDTGSFTVPANVWTTWKRRSTDYINIQVGRMKERTDVLPMDRSTIVGVNEAWVIGAADMN